jgi:hypothetical protein
LGQDSGEGDDGHKGLKTSHTSITQDLTDLASWRYELINQRTEWVADEIVKLTDVNALKGHKHTVKKFKAKVAQ